MNGNRKRIRSAVAALLVGVLLLCALFIAAEGHHDCCGHECAVCACIRQCERVLHTLLDPVAAAAALSVLSPVLAPAILLPLLLLAAKTTPVLEKVRIND